MLQPLYRSNTKAAEPKVKIVRISPKANGTSFVSSDYVSAWHIDVPTHFQISENMNLTRPIKPQAMEFTMLNWVITFFLLAIAAAIFGFGGLAGTFTEIAKFMALLFVVIFVASLVYGAITGRRPNVPMV